MQYRIVYVLFILSVFHSCYAQNQTNTANDSTRYETKDTVGTGWPANNITYQIRKGSKGTVLIASDKGVFRYDARLNDGVEQEKSFINLTSKLGSHRFTDVLEDRKGGLWFASDSGVYYYKASLNDGAGQEKPVQHFTTREGLADNHVICIYEDKTGIIWIGTRGGLSRYDARLNDGAGQGKSFQNFITRGEYAWDTMITTIMEDKTGKLWISARGDIHIYDARLNDGVGQGKAFTTLPNKGERVYDVFSIIEDRKGNIWLGGWDGVRRYNGKTFTKYTHIQGYNFILEDKKGNIWTSGSAKKSSGWALSRYDENSLNNEYPTVTEIMSGPLKTYSGILEADDGSIWFGCNGGLYRYDARLNDGVGQGKIITEFKPAAGKQ